jgi:hypothetical protein
MIIRVKFRPSNAILFIIIINSLVVENPGGAEGCQVNMLREPHYLAFIVLTRTVLHGYLAAKEDEKALTWLSQTQDWKTARRRGLEWQPSQMCLSQKPSEASLLRPIALLR